MIWVWLKNNAVACSTYGVAPSNTHMLRHIFLFTFSSMGGSFTTYFDSHCLDCREPLPCKHCCNKSSLFFLVDNAAQTYWDEYPHY